MEIILGILESVIILLGGGYFSIKSLFVRYKRESAESTQEYNYWDKKVIVYTIITYLYFILSLILLWLLNS